MDVLSKISTIPIMAIEAYVSLVIVRNFSSPALEPPAHLGIFGRVTYYTFHRRFRDYFVSVYTILLVREALHILNGSQQDPLWLINPFLLSRSWIWAFTMTRMESIRYSNRPYNKEEEKLWTKGMTRREYLERKHG
ncbi:hypothetical protein GGR51DRAFT_573747 [Nemania sp. FL0031]|nr:hypothetical protein GGR51DRAFT_573747 [Nemania sp. FL0031]